MKKIDLLLESLEKLHPKYIDLSLNRINLLLNKLDNPHLKLPPCIHIAGTNGKGSTLSLLKHIMLESGYIVHAYTSPHLEKINERFFISNKFISDKLLFETLKYIKKINNKEPITFYEITTAAAFYLFKNFYADFLLLETGLGGRLDATNVINNPLLSIITPISLDHQEYLGNSIKKITAEKLGIVKSSATVITSKQSDTVEKEIKKILKKKKNKSIKYKRDWNIKILNNYFFYITKKNSLKYINPSLIGKHQLYNAGTAITSINYLKKIGYKFNNKQINLGLKNTYWPGRLEKIKYKKHDIYFEGAHNIEGAIALRDFIIESNKKTYLILGMLSSKDINSFLKIFKDKIMGVIAVKIPNQKNSYDNKKIYEHCKKNKIYCQKKDSVKDALNYLNQSNNIEQIIICGSLYLIGEIKKNKLTN